MAEKETDNLKYQKNIRNKIVTTSVTLLLIISICLCLFVVIQVISKGHVSFGGYSFFRVVTGSMEPELPIGSLILTEQADIQSIETGDIISFRSESREILGKIITHRVINKISGNDGQVLLQTKGDANLAIDGYYVDEDNLIGKVIWSSTESNVMSGLLSFFSSKLGFLACIALPCLFISGIILRDCVGKIKDDMKKVMDELTKEEKPAEPAENDKEYEEMYARIREELIEELKQGEEPGESKKEQ